MKVEVVSRETIKPSHPTPQHLRHLKASLFDHVHFPVLVPVIYFYSPQINVTTKTETIFYKLKTSLADTLSLFYPLAGRIKYHNGVQCNDEGVSFVEANVIGTRFDDIINKADVSELDLLVPDDDHATVSSLLLVVQVTTFPCGGIAIGLKINHAIADGISMVMFVNSWASIAKGQDPFTLVPRPYFDTWKEFPSQKHVHAHPNHDFVKFETPVCKRFVVSNDKLIALRTKLYGKNDKHKNSNNVPSLFMILSAFIWSRVKMIYMAKKDKRPCVALYPVNLRQNFKTPKQGYYFGNMVATALVELPMSRVSSDNRHGDDDIDALRRVFVDPMKESMDRILNKTLTNDHVEQVGEDLRSMMKLMGRFKRKEIIMLGFSNVRSLPYYAADFGWGKPIWISMPTPTLPNVVYIYKSPWNQAEIDVYISLSHQDMSMLQNDRDFLTVASKVCGITCKL